MKTYVGASLSNLDYLEEFNLLIELCCIAENLDELQMFINRRTTQNVLNGSPFIYGFWHGGFWLGEMNSHADKCLLTIDVEYQ